MPASLHVVPWSDPLIDSTGHDPRSQYAETFWLPTIGPTSLMLLRHLANRFERASGAVEVKVAETSRALGVGNRNGTTSPIMRTLARLEQFDLACTDNASQAIAVRQMLPLVPPRLLRRLPAAIQTAHTRWFEIASADPRQAQARESAQRLALALVEQGVDLDQIERALGTSGFHPAVSGFAARWVRDHAMGLAG